MGFLAKDFLLFSLPLLFLSISNRIGFPTDVLLFVVVLLLLCHVYINGKVYACFSSLTKWDT